MYPVDKFKMEVVKETKDYGFYKFGALSKGYGETMGNALRRILLSSIEGAAVVSIKVNGVKHEYTTLPGVIDDVLTIMLRLKQLALKSYADKPQVINLDIKGAKVVTAKDIELTSEIELANPELVLTEITDKKGKIQMEITVDKGVGYVLADESKRSEIGVIPLDANFSPVKRVNLKIEKTRVGQQTDLDLVSLEIYTNGAVSPKETLDQAVKIYYDTVSRLAKAISGDIELEEVKKEEVVTVKEQASSSDLDIEKLNLTARLTNGLLKAGYKNLTELEGKTMDELKEIRGLGQKSVDELIETMKSYKLTIKD